MTHTARCVSSHDVRPPFGGECELPGLHSPSPPPGTQRPMHLKDRILERDAFTCVYCSGKATEVDHVRLWYRPCDLTPLLVACCPRCNDIAGERTFYSFEDKAAFIRREVGLLPPHCRHVATTDQGHG